jgi:hypothetical protein
MSERKAIVTPPFRVSFPSVFNPSSYEGGAPKFSVVMLFYPGQFKEADQAKYKAMIEMANNCSLEGFKKKLKDLPDNFRKPFRKGEEKAHMEGYGEGCVFATASSKQMPGVVGRDKRPLPNGEADLYPGCWARATVTAYSYDNKGKGVAFGLHNIQKLGDAPNFSGRLRAEEDFDDDVGEFAEEDLGLDDGDEPF